MTNFLDVTQSRVVVVDGAMGTSIQALNLSPEAFDDLDGCNEVLVRTRPQLIEQIHHDFLAVGCDLLETNSFGSAPWVLDEYGLGEQTEELNRLSAQIARRAADSTSRPDGPWVLGSIGPGTRSPTLSLAKAPDAIDAITYDGMVQGYTRQSRGLLSGGSDGIIIETVYDLLQAKAAVWGARLAMQAEGIEVPLIVSITIEKGLGTMLLGTDVTAALTAMVPLGIDVLGLNCATGPEDMREHIRTLAELSPLPLSIIPNAGIPVMVDGEADYPLSPAELGRAHAEFITDFGVRMVGGCCGTTPDHLKAVASAIDGLAPAPRAAAGGTLPSSLASLYSAVPIEQDNSVLIIGERLNANGSRKFKELLLDEQWDSIAQMARDQVREGAHALDVCVDYVGRDGSADVARVVDQLATSSTLPLVIDSTEVEVIQTALRRLAGRCVINSVNLEDGRRKADVLLPLARQFGSAVICLAIDEEGQARTAEWKVQVCKQIAEVAAEHGVGADSLIFDTLTFPLGSGQEELRGDGLATLEAIERVKQEVPGCHTVLGVSNVSFGLSPAARQALNSVFLHMAVERGLDAAIVNAAKILPLHRLDDDVKQVCTDLINDHRGTAGRNGSATSDYDPLMALMERFEGSQETRASGEELAALPVKERLERRIIDGERDGLPGDLDEAMAGGLDPLDIINTHLLSGMKVVGELFGSGQMQLPFVLQSAECMKAAVRHLEPYMERAEDSSKARIVLATVKGDVHDIGKNLVDIILTNNGYAVRNIGIKQPIDAIIDAAVDFDADAIGLSGLLVKSTVVMREDLEELRRRGLEQFPILLGGAALTRNYVESDLRTRYSGPLFYCRDAFAGLQVMDELAEHRDKDVWPSQWGRGVVTAPTRPGPTSTPAAAVRERSAVATDVDVPLPPFFGTRVVRGLPLDDVIEWINPTALFRNQWGYKADNVDAAQGALRSTLALARAEGLLVPSVVYGYWSCASDGNDVVLYEAPDSPTETARLSFPRQSSQRRLCIADFFRPVESGERDVIALQAVTVGDRISTRAAQLFAEDRYTEYLYLHGLGVETAEALAEYWHARIRQDLSIDQDDASELREVFRQGYQGSRYSFGYSACPDLEQRMVLADLLNIERIGLSLSEAWQLHPEQSTDAIIVHHPAAKYFNAR